MGWECAPKDTIFISWAGRFSMFGGLVCAARRRGAEAAGWARGRRLVGAVGCFGGRGMVEMAGDLDGMGSCQFVGPGGQWLVGIVGIRGHVHLAAAAGKI